MSDVPLCSIVVADRLAAVNLEGLEMVLQADSMQLQKLMKCLFAILNGPSSLVHEICLEKVDDWHLFKFSELLQQRMEMLLAKKKDDLLMAEEVTELDTIGELDRIFIHRDDGSARCQSMTE